MLAQSELERQQLENLADKKARLQKEIEDLESRIWSESDIEQFQIFLAQLNEKLVKTTGKHEKLSLTQEQNNAMIKRLKKKTLRE